MFEKWDYTKIFDGRSLEILDQSWCNATNNIEILDQK
jgi:hypothetical protein